MTFVKCTTCNNQKAKYKLWQNSKNKFEKFCSFDLLKTNIGRLLNEIKLQIEKGIL